MTAAPATASPSPLRAPQPGALPVLILDDERFDRHRIARLCSGLGFPCAVSNARTLTEFSDHLDQGSFDLILVDYALPDGTGLDALHMVRLSARNLNAATLMISGQDAGRAAEAARAIGCAGYLTKDDLSPDSFAAAVTRALSLVEAAAPVPKESFRQADVERLLSLCAGRCARDVKPMISRLMRQMRDLRAVKGGADTFALQALEQNCMSLWAFLIEMEREDGAVLLSDLTADAPATTPPPAQRSRPARPPSPFGRRPN